MTLKHNSIRKPMRILPLLLCYLGQVMKATIVETKQPDKTVSPEEIITVSMFNSADPQGMFPLQYLTLEDPDTETYGVVAVYQKFYPSNPAQRRGLNATVFTFASDLQQINFKKTIYIEDTFLNKYDTGAQEFAMVNNFLVGCYFRIYAYNTVDDTTELILWDSPQGSGGTGVVGFKPLPIDNTNWFLAGQNFFHAIRANSFSDHLYKLDITDTSLVGDFTVEGNDITRYEYFDTKRSGYYIVRAIEAVGGGNTQFEFLVDYTVDFGTAVTGFGNLTRTRIDLDEQRYFLYLFSKDENQDIYWVGRWAKSTMRSLNFTSPAREIIYEFSYEAYQDETTPTGTQAILSHFSNIASTNFTLMVLLMDNHENLGLVISQFDNPGNYTYFFAPETEVILEASYYETIKVGMVATANKVAGIGEGKIKEIWLTITDSIFFPCSDFFTKVCDTINPREVVSCDQDKGAIMRMGYTRCDCNQGYRLGNGCSPCEDERAYSCDLFGTGGDYNCKTGSVVDATGNCFNCSLVEENLAGCPELIALGAEKLEVDELIGEIRMALNVSLKDIVDDFNKPGETFEDNINFKSLINIERDEIILGRQPVETLTSYEFSR